MPNDHEIIGASLSQWLYAEIRESSSDHNRVLDDYGSHIENNAFIYQKRDGHRDRMRLWVDEVDERTADSEEFIGHLVFGGLMAVSGAFRAQCYAMAANEEDYRKLKFDTRTPQRPIGLDVNRSSQINLPKASSQSKEDLEKSVDDTWSRSYAYDAKLDGLMLSSDESSMFLRRVITNRMQKLWLGFTFGAIRYGIDRGYRSETIPVLRPMSISREDQAIIKLEDLLPDGRPAT